MVLAPFSPFRGPLRVLVMTAIALLLWAPGVQARPIVPDDLPDVLKPWVPWVLLRSSFADGRLCTPFVPMGSPETRACVFPARVELLVDDKGATFKQWVAVDIEAKVPLPGNEKSFPLDVRVDGKPAPVLPGTASPVVLLPPGPHMVTGSFAWDSVPESLLVPPETGIVALTLQGKAVPHPKRDNEGTVWLRRSAAPEEGEHLEILVARKIVDDVPLRLTTQGTLHVSGKSREILLGKSLPPGFVPTAIDSPLPTRWEEDGHLRVQLRPGTWQFTIEARSEGPIQRLSRPNPEGPWMEGAEGWAFQAVPETRVVSVEGVPAIDPTQSTMPPAWHGLPSYAVGPGETMTFVEKRRGDQEPPPDNLSLDRTLWLDFDGRGFAIRDILKGSLHRGSRLEMAPPTQLGRFALGGTDQVITRLDGPGKQGFQGIEIRNASFEGTADSRLELGKGPVPAVGWHHDFQSVRGTLHLPPGYRLLYASGVDEVSGTWVQKWSLFEFFLALVCALGVSKLYGRPWGLLAMGMLGLTLPEADAPAWAWAWVLIFEALTRVLPQGKPRRILEVLRAVAVIGLVFVALPFAVTHLREGLYPALAEPMGQGDFRSQSVAGSATPAPEAPPVARPSQMEKAEVEPAGEEEAQGVLQDAPSTARNEVVGHSEQALTKKDAPELPRSPDRAAAPRKESKTAGTALAGKVHSAYGIPSPGTSATPSTPSPWSSPFDPKATVQTGPGLPTWSWTAFPLKWSGPVGASQQVSFWLLNPLENGVLAFLRVGLMALLFLRLFPRKPFSQNGGEPKGGPPSKRSPWALGLGLGMTALVFLGSSKAQAQGFPPKETLDELESRLLKPPACAPACASSGRLQVDVQNRILRLRLEVSSAAPLAFPLPGHRDHFTPEEVLLDGRPAPALRRSNEGHLYVVVDPGTHDVVLRGVVPEGESFQVPLPAKPHHVTVHAEGWTVDGVHPDGVCDDALHFTRIQTNTDKDSKVLEPTTLPPFLRIERTLRFGLELGVETRVVRVSKAPVAASLEVPLLVGESVTTPEARVSKGKVQVSLGPQSQEFSWRSTLAPASTVRLVATPHPQAMEVFRLDASPMWHIETQGIPSLHISDPRGAGLREWKPWPGEDVTLTVIKPEGAPGQFLTLDAVHYDLRPGLRTTEGTLELDLRASRGLQHRVTLPPGAELQSLRVQGKDQPVRQEGAVVTLPVSPGRQQASLVFRSPTGIATFFQVLPVDVGLPAVNITVTVSGLGSRWLLFVKGPRLGPVILFWSLLFVLAGVSAALARIPWVPLRGPQWFLLLLGLSQIPLPWAAVVVGWLLALGHRGAHPNLGPSPWLFHGRQVLLILWTLTALPVLVAAIHEGLLGSPEMQLQGYGSTPDRLAFYQDRSASLLPLPWVLSVPMLGYRAAMLGWALWIAKAVLSWLRWGWDRFAVEGLWQRAKGAPRSTLPFGDTIPPPPVVATPGMGDPSEAQDERPTEGEPNTPPKGPEDEG